jgi:hypothetical protein
VTAPSKIGMTRRFQKDAASRETHLGDPLRLPFARILQEVRGVRVSQAYRVLVTTGACALAAGQQEALYLDTIKGLERHDLDVIVRAFHQLILDMEDRPFTDLLGPLYMEIAHRLDRSSGGEFFTPRSVSRLMAQLVIGNDAEAMYRDGHLLEHNEPAAGTAGMVLTFAEVLTEQGVSPLHSRWTIQDISARSCYAAYVNTTLWGIPAQIVCGDTLRDEVRWCWRNPFWSMAHPLPQRTEEELARQKREAQLTDLVRHFLTGALPADDTKEVV